MLRPSRPMMRPLDVIGGIWTEVTVRSACNRPPCAGSRRRGNLARLAVRLGLGTRFDVANDARGLCGAILAYVLENDLACSPRAWTGGDVKQTALGFLELGLELLAQAFRARLEAVELLLALVKAGLRLSREFSRCSRRSERACMSLLCWRTSSGLATGLLLRCCLILSASSLASMVASRRMFSADFRHRRACAPLRPWRSWRHCPETTRDTTKPTARQTIATTT